MAAIIGDEVRLGKSAPCGNLVKEPNLYDANCPTRRVLDRIGDKWSVLIMLLLATRMRRFAEFRRGIGASRRGCSPRLRAALSVTRTVYAEVPARAEYALTPLGRTLVASIAAIAAWSCEHIDDVEAAQQRYDRTVERHAVA